MCDGARGSGMDRSRTRVLLLGASGSMGSEAFKALQERRDEVDIVLLQRPSATNKALFAPSEKTAGATSIPGRGVVEGAGLKIVWGDATRYDDVAEACKGIDVCLCPMAFISPEADRNPAMAKAVNTTAIQHLVRAIEAMPGGKEHVRLVTVGTVAATGDRLPPVHVGRVGDPLHPSVYDFYACTKITGERAVIESDIRHWAVLRQTFIMIPDVMSLQDPIMFHQPLHSCMENNTARDAGRGLVRCLDIPGDSDFWRRVYNMAGGPACRTTYLEFMKIAFDMLGLDYRNIFERRWFALRNFHMQYFEDSHVLNGYIHNWDETMEDYTRRMRDTLPRSLKVVARLARFPPFKRLVEKATYKRMKALASRPDGTLGWYLRGNTGRITAFYGSVEAYEAIAGWDDALPDPCPPGDDQYVRLDHGYDETKPVLDLADLQGAARFRGGGCAATSWDGDLYSPVRWRCAFGHEFTARPYTVLKAGHWCPEPPCTPPPWNQGEVARRNPFFAQVFSSTHDLAECDEYGETCFADIALGQVPAGR